MRMTMVAAYASVQLNAEMCVQSDTEEAPPDGFVDELIERMLAARHVRKEHLVPQLFRLLRSRTRPLSCPLGMSDAALAYLPSYTQSLPRGGWGFIYPLSLWGGVLSTQASVDIPNLKGKGTAALNDFTSLRLLALPTDFHQASDSGLPLHGRPHPYRQPIDSPEPCMPRDWDIGCLFSTKPPGPRRQAGPSAAQACGGMLYEAALHHERIAKAPRGAGEPTPPRLMRMSGLPQVDPCVSSSREAR